MRSGVVAVVAFVVAVAGCSNPYDEPIPSLDRPASASSYERARERLSDEDRALLDGYSRRADFSHRERTIGDAIAAQRRWLGDEPRRREIRRQLAAIVDVRVVARDRDTSKPGDPVRVVLAVKNLGMKAIRHIVGVIEFDRLGNHKADLELEVDVEPGATVQSMHYLTRKIPGRDSEPLNLGTQPLDAYAFTWKASQITFSDFSHLTAE